MDALLAAHDVALVRAANPGPLTLSGTNTWLVGHDPCWVVDPGPAIDEHVEAVLAAADGRGGIGGIALTHDHGDHVDAAPELARRAGGVPIAAVRWPGADLRPESGMRLGPLEVLLLPGHALDHVGFATGAACLTGDAVLGEGSVFISPDPGALRAYLDGLRQIRERGFAVLLPGHGPPVTAVAEHLDRYIAHRLEREAALVEALARGARTVDEMLDGAWGDVPAPMRPVAAVTLAAHLDKLAEEGRLPDGVQRPAWG